MFILAIHSAEDHDRMFLGFVPCVDWMGSSFGLFLKICVMLYAPMCVAVMKFLWNDHCSSSSRGGDRMDTKEE